MSDDAGQGDGHTFVLPLLATWRHPELLDSVLTCGMCKAECACPADVGLILGDIAQKTPHVKVGVLCHPCASKTFPEELSSARQVIRRMKVQEPGGN